MTDDSDIPRRARGERPYFFEDPAVDQLYAMVLALAGELAVTRDRLDTLERQLAAKDVVDAADIEAYEPDAAAEAEREARRRALIDRLLRVLGGDAVEHSPAAEMPAYTRLIEELKRG